MSDQDLIRFNRATLSGRELEYVAEAVARGHVSGDGPFTKACHRALEEISGARKAL